MPILAVGKARTRDLPVSVFAADRTTPLLTDIVNHSVDFAQRLDGGRAHRAPKCFPIWGLY